MTALLDAPERMKGRGQAADLLTHVQQPLPGERVEVLFGHDSRPTTSFVSQLIDVVADDWGCNLVLRGLPDWAAAIARDLADDANVIVELAPR